jgi:hypothetical protein
VNCVAQVEEGTHCEVAARTECSYRVGGPRQALVDSVNIVQFNHQLECGVDNSIAAHTADIDHAEFILIPLAHEAFGGLWRRRAYGHDVVAHRSHPPMAKRHNGGAFEVVSDKATNAKDIKVFKRDSFPRGVHH